jgi:hypothetical protein
MKRNVYDIALYSPMGPKKGTLTIFNENDMYSADIYLMRHLNHFAVTFTSPGEYSLSGELKTLVGNVACKINVKSINGMLSLILQKAS